MTDEEPPLTGEERQAIVRLFRRQSQLLADLPALITILDTYEQQNKPPRGWRKKWDEMKKTPEYLETLHAFEPYLALLETLETSWDEWDLIQLLLETAFCLPPGGNLA